jgi:RHH-type transcriptional regulator, proline utilization regulon repressor / proline dehydrogenase / delta 1-pyrroline-5-carboxylate dehydrogenase
MATPLDEEVTSLAHRIAAESDTRGAGLFAVSWWADRLIERAMADPSFKTELFRFVDVFPATTGPEDVLRHLDDYFGTGAAPAMLRAGLDVADHVPGIGPRVASGVAGRNITRIASQFILGVDAEDAVGALRDRWVEGSAFTVDLLGEKTVVEREAAAYADRVARTLGTLLEATADWPERPLLERDDLGPLARVNVSVKPTALAPKLAPLTGDVGLDQARANLRPLLRMARDRGAFVHVDMEHADVKDLTLELVRSLLDEDEFAEVAAGVVIQAYLEDAVDDLAELISWSATRPVPLTVRLVKGAYWDTETVDAAAHGWPSPVFTDKRATDANFERCVRLLHDHHGRVRAAFGSHNLRSLAYAITYARTHGIPDDGYELQMLAGMAEPVQAALRRRGHRVRTYAPVGELVPGMAYLVRRLLENTSNESFVRRRVAEGAALDELLQPPEPGSDPQPRPDDRGPTDPAAPGGHRPEPVREWRRRSVRTAFAGAVERAAGRGRREGPVVV